MSRTIYLIHFNRPFSHARHYPRAPALRSGARAGVGSTDNLERRLREHREGNGARLMAAIAQAGIPWTLARTWQGDRAFERQLKRQKNSPRRLCPICRGKEPLYEHVERQPVDR